MVLKQKLHTLANWSVVFSKQSTEDTIPETEFGMTIRGGVVLWAYRSIFLNVEDYVTENQTGASVSTLSHDQFPEPKVGLRIIFRCAAPFIFKKSCCVLCLVRSNFLLTANSLNISIFPYYGMTTHSFVSDACIPSCFAHQLWHHPSCPCNQAYLTCGFCHFSTQLWVMCLVSRSTL